MCNCLNLVSVLGFGTQQVRPIAADQESSVIQPYDDFNYGNFMFEDKESHLDKHLMEELDSQQELTGNPSFSGGTKMNKWNDSAISFEIESDKSKVVYESGVFSK